LDSTTPTTTEKITQTTATTNTSECDKNPTLESLLLKCISYCFFPDPVLQQNSLQILCNFSADADKQTAMFLCGETQCIDTMLLLAHSADFSLARKAISVLYNLTTHCDDVVPLFMKHIPRMVEMAYNEKANKFIVHSMRNILMILAAGRQEPQIVKV